jgi:hypothetical protein
LRPGAPSVADSDTARGPRRRARARSSALGVGSAAAGRAGDDAGTAADLATAGTAVPLPCDGAALTAASPPAASAAGLPWGDADADGQFVGAFGQWAIAHTVEPRTALATACASVSAPPASPVGPVTVISPSSPVPASSLVQPQSPLRRPGARLSPTVTSSGLFKVAYVNPLGISAAGAGGGRGRSGRPGGPPTLAQIKQQHGRGRGASAAAAGVGGRASPSTSPTAGGGVLGEEAPAVTDGPRTVDTGEWMAAEAAAATAAVETTAPRFAVPIEAVSATPSAGDTEQSDAPAYRSVAASRSPSPPTPEMPPVPAPAGARADAETASIASSQCVASERALGVRPPESAAMSSASELPLYERVGLDAVHAALLAGHLPQPDRADGCEGLQPCIGWSGGELTESSRGRSRPFDLHAAVRQLAAEPLLLAWSAPQPPEGDKDPAAAGASDSAAASRVQRRQLMSWVHSVWTQYTWQLTRNAHGRTRALCAARSVLFAPLSATPEPLLLAAAPSEGVSACCDVAVIDENDVRWSLHCAAVFARASALGAGSETPPATPWQSVQWCSVCSRVRLSRADAAKADTFWREVSRHGRSLTPASWTGPGRLERTASTRWTRRQPS